MSKETFQLYKKDKEKGLGDITFKPAEFGMFILYALLAGVGIGLISTLKDIVTIILGIISVVIGIGGLTNKSGQNSSFNTLVAFGGGYGGSHDISINASFGGSGGGGFAQSVGGNGILGQGNKGGNGTCEPPACSTDIEGAGGGGEHPYPVYVG